MEAGFDVVQGVGVGAAVGTDVAPSGEYGASKALLTRFLGDKLDFLDRVFHRLEG